MTTYINFLNRYKFIIILTLLSIILFFTYQLKNLAFEGSYRIWFGENSKILKDYDNFRATFGNDDAVIIAFRDESGIFNKKAIDTIKKITDKLWETKYIARVNSIYNYQYLYADKESEDEIIVENFLQDYKNKKRVILSKEKK